MSSSLDYLELCRLCLVKDRVSVPIFEDEGDVRQIFLKITACLPVKVSREDKLPKKICDDCVYKVELFYQFWNTTANAEKQLLQWLGEVGGLEDKQGYVTEVLDTNVMKQERSSDSRLDGSVMQVGGHQNSMDMGMMDIITMPAGSEQQFTSVPMDTSGTVQTVQVVPGPSTQTTHDQMAQSQATHLGEESEEDNSDDGCDNEEGLPVKEEHEDDQGDQSLETTTFVALPCDEAGPSGLQQQKISEMSEMSMQQTADNDPKTGYFVAREDVIEAAEPSSTQVFCSTEDQTSLLMAAAQSLEADDDNAKVDNNGIVLVPPETLLQCTLCGEAFVDEASFDFHLKSHDVESPVHHQDANLVEETVLVYACDRCDCTCADEDSFHKHRISHEDDAPQQIVVGEKLYTCELCSYSSAHRQNLASHQRRHNLEYKYHCEICGAGFYARNNYQEHLSVHSREKPFQCDICQATFRYRQGLRLHAKLHQPDYVPPQKKHCCEVCNKRFCRKQVLLVHMRTHGSAVPQSEFVCHICGKSVSSKTYLTVHLRKHTGEKPHVCDLCGKGFISQNYLSVHRRTHTGERPHKCTHCEKSFTQRTTLVVHLRSHTGDKPYPCTCCHKSFASKTMLNSHLKTHAKQTARAQQEQRTQLHLQQQNLLLSPEEEALREQQQPVEPDSSSTGLVPT